MHRSLDSLLVVGTTSAGRRYSLSAHAGEVTVDDLTIDDGPAGRIVLSWRGEVARRLVAKNALARKAAKCGPISISKQAAKRLALQAAAIGYEDGELDVAADSELLVADRLWQRLRDLGIRIPRVHSHVAIALFRYPGEHLSAADALCLAQLTFPNLDAVRLNGCLDDLADWGVVQRISVGVDVFYDLETAPHLHLFNTQTRELTDAPTSGVIMR